jgi:DNA-binding protein YbaB
MIADLEAKARDLARRAQQVQDGIRAAEATVRSPDGWVTATVAPNGALRDISFSLPAEGASDAALGEVVMATVRRARAEAARQVAAVVEPEFGGTAAMEFMTSFEPSEPSPVPGLPVPGLPVPSTDGPCSGSESELPRSLWCPVETGGPLPR